MPIKSYSLSWGAHRLELGPRTAIMGVLNVTPDSFSDGGVFYRREAAAARGIAMAEEGADIIDIGGESTRPFSDPVTEEEEIRRVVPVIESIARRISTPISVDTTKANVARRAIEAGAAIINDISALRFDPGMARLAAEAGVPVIVMHMLGTPGDMQVSPTYTNIIAEIKAFLKDAVERAAAAGVSRSALIIDPGLGFGKTFAHNLTLLNELKEFTSLDAPILIGSSRKAFIRNLLKDKSEKDVSPDSPVVETGTQATISAAALNGAHIVRVHEPSRARATLKIIDAIKNAEPSAP
ncbi:MAG: dihydropteroate synthase [Desulfobacterales bacterium]|nr:dihydropteroate synthase [Desulfobacterales bacterium]